MRSDNLLMFADSERDADMLYAVGVFVTDPVIYLRLANKTIIAVGDIEFERARRMLTRCRVLRMSLYIRRLRKEGIPMPGPAHVIQRILTEHGLNRATVPYKFPAGLAKELRDLEVKLEVRSGPCFAGREIKNAEQVKKVTASLLMAEVGLAEGIQTLKRAKIGKGGKLIYHHVPLTAEKLRSIIDSSIVQAGGCGCNTVVSAGRQGFDPRDRGNGLVRANQPIVLDVCMRSKKTGYYGDITRTVVRGRAAETVRKMYADVVRAQELVFAQIRHGRSGLAIHQAVEQFFRREGYKSENRNGRIGGLIYGTGHGVGLEIHETPQISASSTDILRSGHIVAVEPGLHYPSIGGVRLKDIAHVTAKTPRNLTKFEKVLEV